MQQTVEPRSVTGPAVFGIVLIVAGGVALVARATGLDVFAAIGPWGWPFFIIVPGLSLLALSIVPARPAGIGFATAGAIVSTVGLILLYQSRTGNWESWAYAWALIPGSVGLALLVYGAFSRHARMVRAGAWMAAVFGSIFVGGAWYFERLFSDDLAGLDPLEWGPLLLIGLGVIIAVRAILLPRTASRDGTGPTSTAT
jgi:hypothetical protein